MDYSDTFLIYQLIFLIVKLIAESDTIKSLLLTATLVQILDGVTLSIYLYFLPLSQQPSILRWGDAWLQLVGMYFCGC